MRHLPKLAILTWLCIPGLALAAETAAPAPKLELKPCTTIPGLPAEARCGTYEVWENRAAKSGRKIPLRVVVIPAVLAVLRTAIPSASWRPTTWSSPRVTRSPPSRAW